MNMNLVCGTPKLVLDFDGVVFINKNVNTKVIRKSIKYVSKKTSLSRKDSAVFNNSMYMKHGHTVSMLNYFGFENTLEEYNNFVFDEEMWDDIENLMTDQDKHNFEAVLNANSLMNSKSVLFSNAPYIWCSKILDLNGFNINDMFEDIHTCDHDESKLKPNNTVYKQIEENNKGDTLYFLDDNEKNLINLSTQWKTVHVTEEHDLSLVLNKITSII
jgi:hypothetical protein